VNLRLGGRAERDLVTGLQRQMEATAAGVGLALQVAEGGVRRGAARKQMRVIEHDGDEWRANVVHNLSRSVNTPIDREDLFRLSRSIDDVLDSLRDFVREYDLYKLDPDPSLAKVLHAIEDATHRLSEAVALLRSRPKDVPEAALAAKKNLVRRRYQTAMAKLLKAPLTSTTLKQRELLRRLDGVGLRLGDAADAIADGAVKRGR
jgi:uncharacterized protein